MAFMHIRKIKERFTGPSAKNNSQKVPETSLVWWSAWTTLSECQYCSFSLGKSQFLTSVMYCPTASVIVE